MEPRKQLTGTPRGLVRSDIAICPVGQATSHDSISKGPVVWHKGSMNYASYVSQELWEFHQPGPYDVYYWSAHRHTLPIELCGGKQW